MQKFVVLHKKSDGTAEFFICKTRTEAHTKLLEIRAEITKRNWYIHTTHHTHPWGKFKRNPFHDMLIDSFGYHAPKSPFNCSVQVNRYDDEAHFAQTGESVEATLARMVQQYAEWCKNSVALSNG